MRISNRSVIAWVMVIGVLQACDKAPPSGGAGPAQASADAPPSSADAPPSSAQSAQAQSALVGVPGVLDGYERVRAALAADQVDAALAASKQLAAHSTRLGKTAAPGHQAALSAIAAAAAALSSVSPSADDAVRQAFGELSRPVVDWLRSETTLQQGRYLFECPMATGFKLWVQPTSKLTNPYMGARMLRCGASRQF